MIYLSCVYKKNFGDDLLIKCVCDRYPTQKFMTMTYRYSDKRIYHKNLKVIKINNLVYRIIRKLCAICNKKNVVDSYFISKSNLVVSVAGSIFMEPKQWNKKNGREWCYNLEKKYYILGSNVGPVYTQEYVEYISRNILNKAEDVCLRDFESYNLVKSSVNKVRCAPDIVFGLPVEKYMKNKINKKVIFSLINIAKKADQIVNPQEKKYKAIMKDLVLYFIDLGYDVQLFSFCKEEGDEEIIEEILKMDEKMDVVKKYFYDGNMEEALNEFSAAEIVVGTRFHSKILAMTMGKVLIPVIYNSKSRNLLKDIKFKGTSIDIDKIEEFAVENIKSEDLTYKIDVADQMRLANNHFAKLDIALRKE